MEELRIACLSGHRQPGVLGPKARDMKERCSGWLIWSAGVILFATGLAKVVSGLGNAKILAVPDPILNVPFWKLILVVGAAELSTASICLSRSISSRLRAGLVAWTATNFLVYRLGLWWIGWHHPCHCMGSLAGVLHLSDETADSIMKGILVYLLAGSYLVLVLHWRAERLVRTSAAGVVRVP